MLLCKCAGSHFFLSSFLAEGLMLIRELQRYILQLAIGDRIWQLITSYVNFLSVLFPTSWPESKWNVWLNFLVTFLLLTTNASLFFLVNLWKLRKPKTANLEVEKSPFLRAKISLPDCFKAPGLFFLPLSTVSCHKENVKYKSDPPGPSQ